MSEDFNSNVSALFNQLENFANTKTVVGEPIYIGGIILLPLVDINFGMGAGSFSSNGDAKKNGLDSGGMGAKISPSAVIVVNAEGNVQLVNVKNQESVNKLIDLVPGVLAKLNFGPFGKDKDSDENEEDSSRK